MDTTHISASRRRRRYRQLTAQLRAACFALILRQQAAERTAINAPMQGTAADLIKLAMLAVDAWIDSSGVDARLMMQVHDELVFEVADDAVASLSEKVAALMSDIGWLDVPLVVEVGTGDNWDEAH